MTVMIEDPNTTFIHIPKTAGTAISRWLIHHANGQWQFKDTHGGKHAPLDMIKKLRPEANLGFVFVSIRNPWDRMVSGYHYYKKQRKLKEFPSFEKFLFQEEWHQLNKPQAHYFKSQEVDCVIRYENLVEDFRQIQQRFGKNKKPLQRSNRSDRTPDYRTYYTSSAMIDIVAKRHQKDLRRFKYTFE